LNNLPSPIDDRIIINIFQKLKIYLIFESVNGSLTSRSFRFLRLNYSVAVRLLPNSLSLTSETTV